MNPEKRMMLPRVAFAGFASRFREPMLEEGFQDLIQVDFKVSLRLRGIMSRGGLFQRQGWPLWRYASVTILQFEGDDEQRKIWGRYWV